MPSRNLAELLQAAIIRLKQAGIADAEISARALLGFLLDKSSASLQLIINEPAVGEWETSYAELIEKRAARCPLQYLIGSVDFYDTRLAVGNGVFIPRPETELLVETAVRIIGNGSGRVLDMGTGSGCIAIAIARNAPAVQVAAVDISSDALALAEMNAKANGVGDRIEFIQADCFQISSWAAGGEYTMVISNPPYVTESEYETLEPEIRLYEPRQALVVPDEDPLIFYRAVIEGCSKMAAPPENILFEMPAGRAGALKEVVSNRIPFYEIEIIRDYGGAERILSLRIDNSARA